MTDDLKEKIFNILIFLSMFLIFGLCIFIALAIGESPIEED